MLLSPGTSAVGVAAPCADPAQGALNQGLDLGELFEPCLSPGLKYADRQFLLHLVASRLVICRYSNWLLTEKYITFSENVKRTLITKIKKWTTGDVERKAGDGKSRRGILRTRTKDEHKHGFGRLRHRTSGAQSAPVPTNGVGDSAKNSKFFSAE